MPSPMRATTVLQHLVRGFVDEVMLGMATVVSVRKDSIHSESSTNIHNARRWRLPGIWQQWLKLVFEHLSHVPSRFVIAHVLHFRPLPAEQLLDCPLAPRRDRDTGSCLGRRRTRSI